MNEKHQGRMETMKRIIAQMLVWVILLGAGTAAAEGAGAHSWDYDLRLHLETEAFSRRERDHLQGYADLLEILELKGNLAWCGETRSMELKTDLIPVSNPASRIDFRIRGIPEMVEISSPLLGQEEICFNPPGLMYIARRGWETFRLPLQHLVLLYPGTTTFAFKCLTEAWNAEIDPLRAGGVIPRESIDRIAEEWRALLGANTELNLWINALTDPLDNGGELSAEIRELPEVLLNCTDENGLAIQTEEGSLRWVNGAGKVLYEERKNGKETLQALTLPKDTGYCTPSFRLYTAETETGLRTELEAEWARGSGETDDCLVRFRFRAEGLPAEYPAEAAFSGEISLEGFLLPNFHFLFSGKTSPEGKARVDVVQAGQPEAGTVFSCEGNIVPAQRQEPPAYTYEELIKRFNIFSLNDQSLHELVSVVDRPLAAGLINFLYELPVSSCQSIMDDLEDGGIIQLLLK